MSRPRNYKGAIRTLDEIADLFGITRERVRQIEAEALAKMRRRLKADVVFCRALAGEIDSDPEALEGLPADEQLELFQEAETRPEGYFAPNDEPTNPVDVTAQQRDAYLVEVLRVLGPSTLPAIMRAIDETSVFKLKADLKRLRLAGVVDYYHKSMRYMLSGGQR
jgi:hypothetical protein